MDTPYAKELLIAQLAVQRASLATKKVLAAIDQGALSKDDSSPVTIADFAAQALLISAIHHNFPSDTFVGEEAADLLRENPSIQSQVWDLVTSTHLNDPESESLLSTPKAASEMLDVIDLGCGAGGREGRVWVLDPVDGTAAFMRGQQYAVNLALLEDGEEKIGVLGCPNLNLDGGKVRGDCVDKEGYGLMLSAVRGQGSVTRPISSGALQPASKIQKLSDGAGKRELCWIDCVASTTNDLEKSRKIAERLGASWPGTDLWSSLMRYVALTVGGDNIHVHIPKKRTRKMPVWDHAGGHLIFQEVGGKMTDLNGKEFDFGMGRSLDGNYGRIAAPPGLHSEIAKMAEELSAES